MLSRPYTGSQTRPVSDLNNFQILMIATTYQIIFPDRPVFLFLAAPVVELNYFTVHQLQQLFQQSTSPLLTANFQSVGEAVAAVDRRKY